MKNYEDYLGDDVSFDVYLKADLGNWKRLDLFVGVWFFVFGFLGGFLLILLFLLFCFLLRLSLLEIRIRYTWTI